MKKVFKILALIMLIITILKISDTYAKYFTEANTTKEQKVGNWIIKLNETDIYSQKGETIELTVNLERAEDSNTMPGKIAPSSILYGDVILDPTGTDVAVRYDVEFDISDINDFNLQHELSLVGTEKKLTRTAQNTYTGIISLSEVQANTQEQIRFSLIWKNDEENNLKDTEIGSTYGVKIEIPMKITCIQYLGEKITEYTE